MLRVCRPSGRLVIVNHFESDASSVLDSMMDRLAPHVGFSWRLDLDTFLHDAGLRPRSIEQANIPRISSVIVCGKQPREHLTV